QRADVGAVRVAEVDQRRLARGLLAEVVLLAVRVGEDEVGLLERLVEEGGRLLGSGVLGDHGDRLAAVVVAGAAGGEGQAGGGEQGRRGEGVLAHEIRCPGGECSGGRREAALPWASRRPPSDGRAQAVRLRPASTP